MAILMVGYFRNLEMETVIQESLSHVFNKKEVAGMSSTFGVGLLDACQPLCVHAMIWYLVKDLRLKKKENGMTEYY